METMKCSCPDQGRLSSMLAYISQTEAYFGSQQRGTDGLSQPEKEQFAHKILHRSPQLFLSQYKSQLTENHLQYFDDNFKDKPWLIYQLSLIRKDNSTLSKRIKNRRFAAMSKLTEEGEYFNDVAMKQRDPLLYEQMVGQYLSDDEIKSFSDDIMNRGSGLSSLLLMQSDAQETNKRYDIDASKENAQMEESDDDDDDDEKAEEYDSGSEGQGRSKCHPDEKAAYRAEFLHIMQERFMSGQDKDFDYRSVDEDDQYDNIDLENSDAQDLYFDNDDDGDPPEQVNSGEYDY